MGCEAIKKKHTRNSNRVQDGYTIIETLVMLAIVAMISILLLEAIRGATSSGIRIERVARTSVHQHLDLVALRTAIGGTLARYRETPDILIGSELGFSGRTESPIGLGNLRSARYSVRLETRDTELRLIYTENERELNIMSWRDASGRFEYFGHSDNRNWMSEWPQDVPSSQHFSPITKAIRMTIVSTANTEIIIFGLQNTAQPPMRIEDFLDQ